MHGFSEDGVGDDCWLDVDTIEDPEKISFLDRKLKRSIVRTINRIQRGIS